MKGLVSIIIPCYNYGHFLPQALDSVLAQIYQNWECIVIDDGSTDTTKAVVAQYILKDKRFKYIYQQNKGQSPTRNNGLSHSKGIYIQFLDADDILENCKLEEQVTFLEQHPAVDIVYGNVMYFINSTHAEDLLFSRFGKNEPWMPNISGKGDLLIENLIRGNIAELGSLLFRKATIDEVGYWDTSIQAGEDWEYYIRFAIAGKYFQFIDTKNSRVLMRHHPDSFSKNRQKMLEGAVYIHQKIDRMYSQFLSNKLKNLNLQCLNGNKRVLGDYLMRKGNVWQGMLLLTQAYLYEKNTTILLKKVVYLSYLRLKIELSKLIKLQSNA